MVAPLPALAKERSGLAWTRRQGTGRAADPAMSFERIVCGIDPSPVSLEAVRQASELSSQGARMVGVGVWDPALTAHTGLAATRLARATPARERRNTRGGAASVSDARSPASPRTRNPDAARRHGGGECRVSRRRLSRRFSGRRHGARQCRHGDRPLRTLLRAHRTPKRPPVPSSHRLCHGWVERLTGGSYRCWPDRSAPRLHCDQHPRQQ